MRFEERARTAANIARVIMHAEPKKGQMGPVAQGLEALWAYLTKQAMLINNNGLDELNNWSGVYQVEYKGNRRVKKADRMIGITCPKVLFDEVLSYMRAKGVHNDHTKSKNLIIVSVQEIVKKS